MLFYEDLSDQDLGFAVKPLMKDDVDVAITLTFHDDELPEKFCEVVEKKLDEHFKLVDSITVVYEKKIKQAFIEMVVFVDNKADKSKIQSEYKFAFEEYYKKTISNIYYPLKNRKLS